MANQSDAAQAKDHKNRPKTRLDTTTETGTDRASWAGFPFGLLLAGGDGSIAGQADYLKNDWLLPIQRYALAWQISELQGNRHLQRVLQSVRSGSENITKSEPSSLNTVQRAVRQEAERLARTGRTGTWPELTSDERDSIQEAIQGNDRPEAVRRTLDAINPPRRNIVRVVIGGTSMDGEAEALVRAKPNCDQFSETTHWRNHRSSEIRVLVRLNQRLFTEHTLRERAIRLHNTLLHEFTHVEQYATEGIDSHTRFSPVENTPYERLLHETPRESAYIGSLEEIDAASAEIENVERTLLHETPRIRFAVNYLWENYTSYMNNRTGPVDNAIANRVFRNVHRGRRLFIEFLDTQPGYEAILRSMENTSGRFTTEQIIDSWLLYCPFRYSDSAISSHVTDSTARSEATAAAGAETRLRANMRMIDHRVSMLRLQQLTRRAGSARRREEELLEQARAGRSATSRR